MFSIDRFFPSVDMLGERHNFNSGEPKFSVRIYFLSYLNTPNTRILPFLISYSTYTVCLRGRGDRCCWHSEHFSRYCCYCSIGIYNKVILPIILQTTIPSIFFYKAIYEPERMHNINLALKKAVWDSMKN